MRICFGLLLFIVSFCHAEEDEHPIFDAVVGVVEETIAQTEGLEIWFRADQYGLLKSPEETLELKGFKEIKGAEKEAALKALQSKVSKTTLKNILAKDMSYSLCLVDKFSGYGWMFQSDVKFGKDAFKIYPVKKSAKHLRIYAGLILRKWESDESRRDFPYRMKPFGIRVEGWSNSDPHKNFVQKVAKQVSR